jgi:hypothetical protein
MGNECTSCNACQKNLERQTEIKVEVRKLNKTKEKVIFFAK